jgi:hypothetical protein
MVLPIAGIVAAARLARAAQVATRTASGIKTAKTVEKIYREGSASNCKCSNKEPITD